MDTLTTDTLAEALQEPEKGRREPCGQQARWSTTTLACLLFGVIGMTGCAAIAALPIDLPSGPSGSGPTSVLTRTEVHLTQRNYRVVQTNLRGTSWGFALLGILVLKPPDATEAFAKLLAGVENLDGQAVAVINVMQDSSAPFFLLFSLPKITFRADVVEFIEP